MHDLRVFREQLDQLREGMRRRQKLEAVTPLIEQGIELDAARRATFKPSRSKRPRATPTRRKSLVGRGRKKMPMI